MVVKDTECVKSLLEKLKIKNLQSPPQSEVALKKELALLEKNYKTAKHNLLISQDSIHQAKRDAFLKLQHKKEEVCKQNIELENEKQHLQTSLRGLDKKEQELLSALSAGEKLNLQLQTNVAKMRNDQQQQDAKFRKTWKTYLAVMAWYKKFLGIHIRFGDTNNQVTVFFGYNIKDFDENRCHVTFEILKDNKWKVINIHPLVEVCNQELQELKGENQVAWFLCRVRHSLLQPKLLNKLH